MPAAVLKGCLPRNGMKWGQGAAPNVTRRHRIDANVVAALRSLGVPIQKRDVQVEFTNLVNEATALAERVVAVLGRDVERSEFTLELHQHNRLGRLLSPLDFEQIFTTIVLARYRYISDRWDDDLPDENPANHCHLARAVDAFEKAAWFWSTPVAFLEDDHIRADERGRASSESDGEDQNRAADSSAATTNPGAAAAPAAGSAAAAAAASIAAANDSAVVSLAAGVDAMDLDDAEDVGSEMEVD
ncbi:hypothetical protein C8A00DRAFT_18370 [Chaetomidium leptoderma]|uniref:Uncharacterized protein n=1 Tax=Chaetomidium leptoderma TaxID=669021 RepID=A0AAN6VEK4_9PEZI|nr:hypothetical protein C8A00DRAFT_18370 [Chaetomidium leptoderma]